MIKGMISNWKPFLNVGKGGGDSYLHVFSKSDWFDYLCGLTQYPTLCNISESNVT